MFTTLILAASSCGPVPCDVRTRNVYAAPTYAAAPAYAPAYAAPAYYYPKARVETAIIATELYDDQVYGTLVGGAERAANRRSKDARVVAELTARIGELSAAVRGLQGGVPQPSPVAPGKPEPQPVAPGKPEPQPVSPVQPPLPSVNPDDEAPPPPTVPSPPTPNPGGIVADPDETAMFQRRCANCHSVAAAGKSGGGRAFFTQDGTFQPGMDEHELLDMYFRVKTGNMPKKANPLTPEELGVARGYVAKNAKVKAFLDSLAAK